jgi:hypothetical protein
MLKNQPGILLKEGEQSILNFCPIMKLIPQAAILRRYGAGVYFDIANITYIFILSAFAHTYPPVKRCFFASSYFRSNGFYFYFGTFRAAIYFKQFRFVHGMRE